MRQWWWLSVGGFLLLITLVWWVVRVTSLESGARGDASGYGQFLLAAVGLPISLVGLWKALSPSSTDLDEVVDRLAVAMREQAERSAVDRRLVQPTPLSIRWRRSTTPVAGPVAAATATHDGRAWLDPLPGLPKVTVSRLRSGSRQGLHAVYGGLPSGRLLITGDPGAGKSSAAVLLMLDALRFREQAVSEDDRRRIPVPVLLTLQGWNPETTPVTEWLTGKLGRMPLFKGRHGALRAREVLATGRVSVFLDGLDEIPEVFRPSALKVLSEQATFRLVLLTRTTELVEAARQQSLTGAVALHIDPLMPKMVAEYLLRPLTEPAPAPWQRVADALINDPNGPLAKALKNPLWVSLLHDIYPPTGQVDELLDISNFPTAETVTGHLLDRLISAAYAERPGQPQPRYTLATAHQTLALIARHMNAAGTRDLAWWQTPEWMHPASRFTLLTLTNVVSSSLSFGFTFGLFGDASAGLLIGLVLGAILAPLAVAGGQKITTEPSPSLRKNLRRNQLLYGPLYGAWAGLITSNTAAGIMFGLSIALFLELRVNSSGAITPLSLWYQERRNAIAAGIAFGSVFGSWVTFAVDPLAGLIVGAPFVPAIGLMLMPNWAAGVSQGYLAMRHGTPIRLIRFLEDARTHHLVRTVGPVYQFRHATLQDRLASARPPVLGGEPPSTP